MMAPQTSQHLTKQALQQVAGLILIDVILIFVLPANHAALHKYHFSPLEYRTILLGLSLPALATWVAAFFGYSKLLLYVQAIKGTPEGPHFYKLAAGCRWLAWSLPVSAILLLILGTLANHWPHFYPAAVIIRNYTNIAMSVIAFTIIGNASRGLVNQAKLKFSLPSIRIILVLFLGAGVLYCYLIFKHFDLASLGSTKNAYYLPAWLLVVSVIVPYLYAWFSGLLAAYEIDLFSKRTHGVLYRQALRLLAMGLLTIIFGFVALQYTTSLHTDIGSFNLDYQRLLATLFRVTSGAGFIMVALGAMRLKKIEEV